MLLEDLMQGRLIPRDRYREMMKHPRAIQPDGAFRFHLVPTYHCNLTCPECHEPKGMEYTYEELRDVVDEVVAGCPSEIIFEFFGGEPLLRFDIMEQVFTYIETA